MACRFEYNGKSYSQDELAKELEKMPPHEAHKYIDGVQNIPDAPFKKTWHELALKRMIREAAEKGYNRLSWTPGEAQAARYDLSKQVEGISAFRNDDGTFMLGAKRKGGSGYDALAHSVPKEKLAESVGKELAQKIVDDYKDGYYLVNKKSGNKSPLFDNEAQAKEWADKNNLSLNDLKLQKKNIPTDKQYTGLDLKIGGEGMKGFYDKMIPNAIEKIGKKHGVKVKQGNLPADKDKILKNRDFTKPDEIAQKEHGPAWDDLVNEKNKIDIELAQHKHGNMSSAWAVASRARKHEISNEMDDLHSTMIDNTVNRLIKNGKGDPVHYIDIPESLKSQALGKGFPLFSSGIGGMMLTPVNGNPWAKNGKDN